MGFRIARRAAVAAASVTVAAAGLLATGGPASAAALPTDGRVAVVSHPVRLLDTHDEGRGSDDDSRGRWVSDQIEWMRDHDRVSYRLSDDDSRRHWVSDQIEWMRDHHGAHHWVSEHEGRSYR
ncbi:hypothetical protein [Streptomyces sp. NBC_01669]|uniref:hypothetical protein n=1 Tax=Streptomyces sp. NBC_01669 TaxID=2975909 RepID=UPI0022589690|nr:hypothetical protein [Streptomyces sp. NBC_01669]MCX4537496.1 hypothetical protein [Streptomyces sp. NBC_01669]